MRVCVAALIVPAPTVPRRRFGFDNDLTLCPLSGDARNALIFSAFGVHHQLHGTPLSRECLLR